MSEIELRAEIDHHDRARAAMEAMRTTTVTLTDKFQVGFIEGNQNRYAYDAGPDLPLVSTRRGTTRSTRTGSVPL